MSGWWSATRSTLRIGLRSDAPTLVATTVLVATVAGGVLFGQRSVEQAEEDSLARTLAAATPAESRLRVTLTDEFSRGTTAEPLAAPQRSLDTATESLDPVALAAFGPARLVVDSPRFTVASIGATAPSSPTSVLFRVHDDLDDHATLIAGRPAAPTDERIDDQRVLEIELASQTAADLGWSVGTEALVVPDTSDSLFLRFSGVPDPFWLRVVGVLELDDESDPYWYDDARLHRAIVDDTGVGADFTVFASVSPALLPELLTTVGGSSGLRVEQRRDLVPEQITMANVDAVQSAATSVASTTTTNATSGRPGVSIGLGALLRAEADRRAVAAAAVLIASVGVMAVAVAALVQIERVGNSRRRPWWRQARARGASASELVSASVVTTAAAVVLGTVIGVSVGAAAHQGGTESSLTGRWGLFAAFAIAVIALTAADQIVEVRERLDESAGATSSRGRRAAGLVIVLIAVAGVVTLRRRGLSLDADSIDPALLLPVVFVPLAAIVVVTAVIPVLIGSRPVGSLRIGVGRLVGVRRGVSARGGPSSLAVLALAASITLIATTISTSIGSGIETWSWREVGAEQRLDTRAPEVAAAIAAAPDVVAATFGESRVLAERDDEIVELTVVSLDVAAHRTLTAGTPVDRDLPDELFAPRPDGAVPVVATGTIGDLPVVPGDRLSGVGVLRDVELVVVATVADVFGAERDTVLADRTVLEEVSGRPPSVAGVWFDGPIGETVVDSLADPVVVRADVEAERRTDPLTQVSRRSFAAAAVAAALLGLSALVATLIVTMRSRRRDVGLLAALGADRREFGRSVRAEALPAALIGVAVGVAAGAVTLDAMEGRLDVGPLTGAVGTAIRMDTVTTVAVVLALAVAVVATVWFAGSWVARAPDRAVDVLRTEGAA